MGDRIPPPTRLVLAATLVAAFLVTPEVASPREACAIGHTEAYFVGFAGGPPPPHFYVGAEDDSPARARIEVYIHGCPTQGPVQVRWETEGGTATVDSDFQDTDATSPDLNPPCEDDCAVQRAVDVPVLQDPGMEAVVEYFTLNLSNLSGRVIPPSAMPVYLVDDDGSARVAFPPAAAQSFAQAEYQTSARIPVFRAGDASGTTVVSFSLSGGTAEPNDFSVSTSTITFAPGERMEFLPFTIANDDAVEGDETITASLSGPAVVQPSTRTFTILDEDVDEDPPVSRFHHPKDGWKYDYNDLLLREMHTIARDVSVSGVARVEMALRQRRMDGSCRWWDGDRFVWGSCGSHRWLTMEFQAPWSDTADIYARAFPPLAPSIGTKIRNYTAWTWAEDEAGNRETTFQRGRNLSTFEVRQS
jgi:Calx-beta domain